MDSRDTKIMQLEREISQLKEEVQRLSPVVVAKVEDKPKAKSKKRRK